MREIDDRSVDALTSVPDLLTEVRRCLADLGTGAATQAPKQMMPLAEGGFFLSLAGMVPRLGLAVAKWASYRPGPAGFSTSTIIVSDIGTGRPLALLPGMRPTQLRTAASALVVADAARPGSATGRVGLVGFGPTNRTVLELLRAAPAEVVIVVRTPQSAARVRESVPGATVSTDPGALTGADLVFSATGAAGPVGDLAALAADGVAIALDGRRTWRPGDGAVLTDQPSPGAAPEVARLVAGTLAVPAGRLLLDVAGSAVADVAMAAVLLHRGRS